MPDPFSNRLTPSASSSKPGLDRRCFLERSSQTVIGAGLAAGMAWPLGPLCAHAAARATETAATSRAIVIGIDKYSPSKQELRDLHHPAKDALKFLCWLLKAKVSADAIELLIDPTSHLKDLEESVPKKEDFEALKKNMLEPSSKNIFRAISSCATNGTYDRLYFFYSGHGSMANGHPNGGYEPTEAIYPMDYESVAGVWPISLRRIFNFLYYCPIKDQYFALDCCRNVKKEDLVATGPNNVPDKNRQIAE
jgi:hypothetical protein